jgi:hypothetical protein
MATVMINSNEIIDAKFWRDELCPVNYETGDTLPDGGVVYVNIEHITDFFKKCQQTTREFTIVSAYSDFGLAIQEEHPVAVDMIKWWPFVSHEVPKIGYNDLHVPSRCEKEKCNIDDIYSIKCYAYTLATFGDIPKNIKKWYLSNSMTNEDMISGIPMGVGEGDADIISSTPKLEFNDKKNLMYANWQTYTTERVHLKHFLEEQNYPYVTYRKEPTIPKDEYLRELAEHHFVLCPEGNGVDCHRIWEAMYLGVIPIVLDSPTMSHFEGLPLIRVNNFFQLSEHHLITVLDEVKDKKRNLEKITKSYWKQEILNGH